MPALEDDRAPGDPGHTDHHNEIADRLVAIEKDPRLTNSRPPSAGSVVNGSLSPTGLTVIPRIWNVLAVGDARPAWGGPIFAIVRYTPFVKPTNAVAGDLYINGVQ